MQTDLYACDGKEANDPHMRWATQDDTQRIANMLWDEATIRQHFREGARAVIIEGDDIVKGCSWFKPSAVSHDHWLKLSIPADTIFSMQTFIRKEERGKQNFSRMIGFGNQWAIRQGFKRAVNIVDRLNRNSWTARQRIGGHRVGQIFVIGVAGHLIIRIGKTWRCGRWNPSNRLLLPFDSAVD